MKLSGDKEEINNEETYDVVMAPEELLPEDLEIAALTPEVVKVETNRAYNEAEKFISSVENENQDKTETTEGKLQEMNDALENSKNENGKGTSLTKKVEKEKKAQLSNSESGKDAVAVVKSGNRNTTISYQLVNRKDMDLPNPVYTCYGFGKVVVNIEVNNLGKVVKNSYNKTASTTSNECLIDAALEYAEAARFNTDASKEKQLGTITFNFPGQQ
ncbi:energy transducer TonB [Aequorivita sublithincola]|nr:energy transducer TonB [Aequorivita sublithincola]